MMTVQMMKGFQERCALREAAALRGMEEHKSYWTEVAVKSTSVGYRGDAGNGSWRSGLCALANLRQRSELLRCS